MYVTTVSVDRKLKMMEESDNMRYEGYEGYEARGWVATGVGM